MNVDVLESHIAKAIKAPYFHIKLFSDGYKYVSLVEAKDLLNALFLLNLKPWMDDSHRGH